MPKEETLLETEPATENLGAPTREEERNEQDLNRDIEKARADIDMAIALNPDNPKAQALRAELMGADAKSMDAQKVERIAREAQDMAAQSFQEETMGGVMAIAGLGAVLATFGVIGDGKEYHPAQTGAGDLPKNIAGLPQPKLESGGLKLS